MGGAGGRDSGFALAFVLQPGTGDFGLPVGAYLTPGLRQPPGGKAPPPPESAAGGCLGGNGQRLAGRLRLSAGHGNGGKRDASSHKGGVRLGPAGDKTGGLHRGSLVEPGGEGQERGPGHGDNRGADTAAGRRQPGSDFGQHFPHHKGQGEDQGGDKNSYRPRPHERSGDRPASRGPLLHPLKHKSPLHGPDVGTPLGAISFRGALMSELVGAWLVKKIVEIDY